MKRTFKVTYNGPEVAVKTLKKYIQDAVRCWGLRFEFEHPLFKLSNRNIKVTLLPKAKK